MYAVENKGSGKQGAFLCKMFFFCVGSYHGISKDSLMALPRPVSYTASDSLLVSHGGPRQFKKTYLWTGWRHGFACARLLHCEGKTKLRNGVLNNFDDVMLKCVPCWKARSMCTMSVFVGARMRKRFLQFQGFPSSCRDLVCVTIDEAKWLEPCEALWSW